MPEDKKISELTENPAITGTEEMPTERGGANYKNTFDDLKTFVNDGVGNTVKSSVTDTTPAFLLQKLISTDGSISIELDNQGGDENVDLKVVGKLKEGENSVSNNVDISKELSPDSRIGFFLDLDNNKSSNSSRGYVTDINGTVLIERGLITGTSNVFIVCKQTIESGTGNEYEISVGISDVSNEIIIKNTEGKGVNFNDYLVDEANLGAWGTTPNQISSDARIIANLPSKTEVNSKVNSVTSGEPTGSGVVLNIVSITQAEYNAGTPNATTIYNITDA